MSTNWRLGLSFSLVTAIMWGALPIALKVVLGEMDSITVTWYRFSISAAIALAWYGRRSVGAIKRLLSRPLWPFTLLAVAGLLTNYIFYLIGLDHTTAEAAQILIQLAPLMLLVGSVWFFKEPFSAAQWLGVIAFTVGLLLFFHHRLRTLASIEESYLLGLFVLLLAAITWAGYGLAQKYLLKYVNQRLATFDLYRWHALLLARRVPRPNSATRWACANYVGLRFIQYYYCLQQFWSCDDSLGSQQCQRRHYHRPAADLVFRILEQCSLPRFYTD